MLIKAAITLLGGVYPAARALGISAPTVYEWTTGKRNVPPKRCVQIEKLTGGVVTRADLRPNDYWEIWLDLPKKENHNGN